MKISLISDLHLDISGPIDLPGGDLLILAGDACEEKSLKRELKRPRKENFDRKNHPCMDFFYNQCAKYNKVLYVLGNHEHYGGKLYKTKNLLQEILPTNIEILENQSIEYNGIIFIGATLWTDMHRADPVVLQMMKGMMNDYGQITFKDNSIYRPLQPVDTVGIHIESLKYFKKVLSSHSDKQCVIISHMAPHNYSIDDKFKGELSNAAFYSDLSDVILDNPNIKIWTHGHVHNRADYTIGNCRVLCNPRGYLPHESGNEFDETFTFEI